MFLTKIFHLPAIGLPSVGCYANDMFVEFLPHAVP